MLSRVVRVRITKWSSAGCSISRHGRRRNFWIRDRGRGVCEINLTLPNSVGWRMGRTFRLSGRYKGIFMRLRSIAVACLLAGALPTSAFAAQVMDGTVSSVGLFNPTISLGTTESTYSATNGGTFEISGTGGFSNIGGTMGTLNGLLTFSNIVGTTVSQSLNNFFVFSDATGGTYNYSVTSAQTRSFVNQASSTSGTLYLLGDIVDSSRNLLTLTPASLSIQFNNTGRFGVFVGAHSRSAAVRCGSRAGDLGDDDRRDRCCWWCHAPSPQRPYDRHLRLINLWAAQLSRPQFISRHRRQTRRVRSG